MSDKEFSSLYPEAKSVRISEVELTNERSGLKQRTTAAGKAKSIKAGLDNVVGAVVGGASEVLSGGKKKRPMLTSSQLSDLFTRLDKNGDGELDLDEFTGIIKMLKIKVTPDYISRVFRSVDQAGGSSSDAAGTLDMQEFIAAYQMIYTGAHVTDVDPAHSNRKNFVRATRYGCTAEGNYVFECYTIPSDAPSEKYEMKNLPNENSILGGIKNNADPLDMLSATKGEPWLVNGAPGTVENIYQQIKQDGLQNKLHHASVFWWVDAAFSTVDRTTAEELVSKFGLPNNSKFLASFGNFGNGLPADPKSRMFAGIGNHTLGSVHSLSYFAQSLYVKQVPVVHHLPPWLKTWQCSAACTSPSLSAFIDGMVKYYTSRFAWLANLSDLSKTAADEKISAYERAEGLATLLKLSDADEDDEEGSENGEDDDAAAVPDLTDFAKSTIFSSRGSGVPLRRRTGYDYPPTWLRSNSQIYANPAFIRMDTLGLHILDQGYGPNALLTVRQIDPEKQQKRFTLEQQSRTGVLGRIISGVWAKVAEVTARGRGCEVAGELTDSPASLVTFLLMMTHSFSMNSCASVDYWINVLEKEIKDMVVSKHSLHLAEVERILKEFGSYLDPVENIFLELAQQQEAHTVQQVPSAASASADADGASGALKRRKSVGVMAESHIVHALPDNIEKIPLSFAAIHTFFGTDPYRELRAALDGYQLLDLKGLGYWKERLRKYSAKVEGLKDLISSQLDEKRNFMSFMLTIVTTLLAPLAILTGYFGMNFDNMKELDHTMYPAAPGVTLMWVICGVCYGVMLLYSLHFRVFYSAT